MRRTLTVLLVISTMLAVAPGLGATASAAAVKSSWYGTFTAKVSWELNQTDGSVTTRSSGTDTVSFTAAQDIAHATVHLRQVGQTVTDDGAGCVITQSWELDNTSGSSKTDGAFIEHEGSRWLLQPASSSPLRPVHTSVSAGCPSGPSEGDSANNHTQSPLLQVPLKVVKVAKGLKARGGGAITEASLNGADYTGWYPGEFTRVGGSYTYSLTYGPTPKKQLEYSLSGVCGKVKGSTGERCYIMLGGATIRAIKKHEKSFAGVVAAASQKALGHAARKVAVNFAEKKAKSELVSYAIKKLAGSTVATGFGGFSFGQMLGKIFNAAAIAQRWDDLEEPGFPHKCFVFQATYDKGKAKLGLDPVWSFVRSWDAGHPPARPKSTSFAHWEAPGNVGATLPMFCSGAGAKATLTAPSSGLSDLLAPPYVRFSVDFNH